MNQCLVTAMRSVCSSLRGVQLSAFCQQSSSLLPGIPFSTESTSSPTPAAVDGETAPCLAKQYMDPSLMSRSKRLQQDKHQVIRAFQYADKDVGSIPVQVALLTHRIRSLETHFKQHRHDHHSMRGLQALVQQRRRSLQYLRRTDFTSYSVLLHKLGLKDAYSSTHRLDKYKIGTRLPYPTEKTTLYKQAKKKKQ